jgi:hypothetical protein
LFKTKIPSLGKFSIISDFALAISWVFAKNSLWADSTEVIIAIDGYSH